MELARLGLIPSIVESTSSADTQSSMHFDRYAVVQLLSRCTQNCKKCR